MRAIPLSPPRSFLSSLRSIFIATIGHRLLCVSMFAVTFASMFVGIFLSACTPVFAQEASRQESQQSAQTAAASHPLITQSLTTQSLITQSLITQSVDESQLTTLRGNTHPLARPQFDLGAASASLPMKRMLLVLKRSPDQEAALRKLLDDQQDKASPNYHQWLTPEQYGKQFGPTDADLQTITAWLQSHGFEVGSTKGRTVLEFSGSAGQVQEAFHTSIHSYLVNGEQHWANSTDPQIPSALTPAVAGVSSLNNFPKRAMNAPAGSFWRDKATGKIHGIKPEFTFPNTCIENNEEENACYYGLGPYDFATIYNVLPLWNAGINGTGETIAIVGESNIDINDVSSFRSMFGLPANNPTIILNGPDPGLEEDEAEADIDVQWSGAVAPQASIDFVVSQSTETTAGVDLSAVYIVENNLAPVMSESYGECELGLGTTGNQFYSTLWQQAAAQGITVMISAGDNGAAGCDNFDAQSPAPAQYGLQVSGFASTPYNVAVGGTDFNDFSNPGTYWSTTNNSTTQASALSYIPETTWNDSCTNALFLTVGYSSNPETNCNNSQLIQNFVVPEGGSGGVSRCTTPSSETPAGCAGGYAKPAWQTGSGVPADGKRDVPDLSLFASNGFVGSFYIICESDQTGGSCDLNSGFLGYGGTSVASPAFAGIMALVNQQTGSRQGNANYILYKLAAQQPTAFHDVTVGTIAMPCSTGSSNCVTSTAGDAYGVLSGYNTTTGYDLATGLGSVNANNLVTKWTSITLAPTATTLNSLTPTTITHGQAVTFNVSVKPQTGTGVPTGTISFEGGPTNSIEGIAGFNLANGAASGSTDLLPGGTYSVIAHYPGDSTYGASDSAPISVTVGKENSNVQAFLETFDANGNVISGNAITATYGSPYVLRVNVENSARQLCAPVATSGATACPSGNVTLTDNGSTLDAGTYPLNSYGNVEDFTVQLPGGTDSVKAAYGGDNSFNSSSATSTISITPAGTTTSASNAQNFSVSSQFLVYLTIQSQSSGVAPTGTATVLVNGTPISGTTSYSGTSGSFSNPQVTLNVFFQSSASPFPKAGTYTVSASYSGDGNYAPSNSANYSVIVQYPTPQLSIGPTTTTVASGTSVTVTAIIDTNLSNVPVPTGTVPFSNWGPMTPITGTETYSTVTDSNGNVALQASLTFVPAASMSVSFTYPGDSNYPSASGGGLADIVVTGSDFSLVLTQPSLTVSPGGGGNLQVWVQGQSSYSGMIDFLSTSCSGMPSESSCTFSPASFSGNGLTTLAVNTTAPTSQAAPRAAKGRFLSSFLVMPFALVLLLGVSRRQSRQHLLLLLSLGVLFIGLSCGGGSSAGNIGGTGGGGGGGGGGGTTDPGTPVGSYTITVTAISGSISHSATFTLVVQ